MNKKDLFSFFYQFIIKSYNLILSIPNNFWRFSAVGVGGLFVDITILYTLIWQLHYSPLLAKIFSFLSAATFTWWMNRNYTFNTITNSLFYEWIYFLGTNSVGGIVNFIIYSNIVNWYLNYQWSPALATICGSLGGLIFNYLGSYYFVFNLRK